MNKRVFQNMMPNAGKWDVEMEMEMDKVNQSMVSWHNE